MLRGALFCETPSPLFEMGPGLGKSRKTGRILKTRSILKQGFHPIQTEPESKFLMG